jgi:hypothetical protein
MPKSWAAVGVTAAGETATTASKQPSPLLRFRAYPALWRRVEAVAKGGGVGIKSLQIEGRVTPLLPPARSPRNRKNRVTGQPIK